MIEIITHPAFIWTVVGLVAAGLLLIPITFVVASYFVYTLTLRRNSEDQWSRDLPSSLDPLSVAMYEAGQEWAKENAHRMSEVHTVRDGLNLYGEYYDFGSDRCTVILSGRTETLKYGYYFAIPYSKYGTNILVLDPRAHGKSEGKFNTVGFEESEDLLVWLDHIKKEKGVKSFILHGICIGAGGGMLALTSGRAPDYIEAIVTEGMFPNFSESMKNHLIERKKPVFIMNDLIDLWMKHYTGHSMKKGPIDVISRLDRPLLMLHSKEDNYSTPEYAQKLFDLAGCEKKKIVWFPHGRHSMLRIIDTEKYDKSIEEFLNEITNTVKEK